MIHLFLGIFRGELLVSGSVPTSTKFLNSFFSWIPVKKCLNKIYNSKFEVGKNIHYSSLFLLPKPFPKKYHAAFDLNLAVETCGAFRSSFQKVEALEAPPVGAIATWRIIPGLVSS